MRGLEPKSIMGNYFSSRRVRGEVNDGDTILREEKFAVSGSLAMSTTNDVTQLLAECAKLKHYSPQRLFMRRICVSSIRRRLQTAKIDPISLESPRA